MAKTYYFETTEPIYGSVEDHTAMTHIEVKLKFHPDRGYFVEVQPCSYAKYCSKMISRYYCREYYDAYFGYDMLIVEAHRRSSKKQQKAEQFIDEHAHMLAQKYAEGKHNTLGNPIILTGDYVVSGEAGVKV